MIDEKEFKELRKEHNKAAMWIEYFSHKVSEMEEEIKNLKKEADKTKEKEEILGKALLKLINENSSDKENLKQKKSKK